VSQTHLTLAETARSLLTRGERAVLGSLSDDGFPFSSLVEIAPLPDGDALVLMSDLAQHAKNIKRDPRASLLLTDDANSSSAFASGRATLSGELRLTEAGAHLETYRKHHPKAALGTFHDFRLYHFVAHRAHIVAGFGRVGRVDAEAYREARPDMLASSLRGIVTHMNEDHAQNLLDYAHAFMDAGWATRARMIGMDRFGMDLHLHGNSSTDSRSDSSGDSRSEVQRYTFPEPLEHPSDSRKILVALAKDARVALGKPELQAHGTH
jgi:heme iron utilization protein